MTDYLNPHRIGANYPIVNRAGEIQTERIDNPPGFDSDRTPKEPLVVPTVKESLTTEPTQIDRIKKLEKEVEQLKKYFECFARLNRLGLPEVEV